MAEELSPTAAAAAAAVTSEVCLPVNLMCTRVCRFPSKWLLDFNLV